jgi:hypothetical protein
LLNACACTVALEEASRTLADHSKQMWFKYICWE